MPESLEKDYGFDSQPSVLVCGVCMVIGQGRPPWRLSSHITHARLCFRCRLSCVLACFQLHFCSVCCCLYKPSGLWSISLRSVELLLHISEVVPWKCAEANRERKTALRHFTRHDSRSLRGDPPGFPGDQTRNFKKKNKAKKKLVSPQRKTWWQ